MEIRCFSADLKTKLPGGHPGLYAVPIQLDRSQLPIALLANPQALAERANGLPLLLSTPVTIVAMYFDPHASMDEHSADHPIFFLVTAGQGHVRIGGPNGETRAVSAGDGVLWPAHLDHTAWTDGETMQAIVIEAPPEREQG